MAQIARAAWHPDEASALISTNRSAPGVPEWERGADWAFAGRRSTAREFSARRFISRGSERDNYTAR